MMFLLFGIITAYLVIRMMYHPSHSTCPQRVGNSPPNPDENEDETIGAGTEPVSGPGPLKSGFGPIVPPSQVNHNRMSTIDKKGVMRGAMRLQPSTYRAVSGKSTGVDINSALRPSTKMPSVSGNFDRDNVSDKYYQTSQLLKKAIPETQL